MVIRAMLISFLPATQEVSQKGGHSPELTAVLCQPLPFQVPLAS